jgi:hypothetical protein
VKHVKYLYIIFGSVEVLSLWLLFQSLWRDVQSQQRPDRHRNAGRGRGARLHSPDR